MWFEIPKEHADAPEAKRLVEIYTEFAEACAQQCEAITKKHYESAPAAFEALGLRARTLQHALKDAEIAFDQATGEPKPVGLPPDLVREINRQFSTRDCNDVIAKLSKTLGYLRRQRVEDDRIAKYVLILANGNKEEVFHYADIAQIDFRDIILWVENPGESQLDTPEKIEDFQKTLEWLCMKRDAELEREKQRLAGVNAANNPNKPWWRFW